MLTILVPYVGLAAFSLVLPITYVILGVLILVTLSYREVVMVYTKAGGSYVVARDNFGVRVAQIAAVALLIDYTVTVAVQTAAGTNALTSAVPSLVRLPGPHHGGRRRGRCSIWNLRGLREAGRVVRRSRPISSSSAPAWSSSAAWSGKPSAACPRPMCTPPGALPLGHPYGKRLLDGAPRSSSC